MIGSRIRRSMAAKLFIAQLLVIVAGAATLALVAVALAPGLFRSHVRDALGIVSDDVARHLDEAFDDAVFVALGVAIAAAVVAAVGVSLFLSLRIVRPIRALAEAAQRVARGVYSARAQVTGTDELATLGSAFNTMAASLESTERRRRELLADLAHELRTPLATVEGYVEGLADGVVPPTPETWRVIQTETRRLARLVDDLQKVSRTEERQVDLRVAATDPGALVEAAIRGAAPAYAAKGVLLEARVDRPLPSIEVDSDRMGEVLANLLENALRHTPTGGRVEVGVSRRGGAVELAVADTGEGIAPEHLERIFERFYRADPARTRTDGGSGIGLTIGRAIVTAHGGTIRAESHGASGARLVIALPIAAARRGSER